MTIGGFRQVEKITTAMIKTPEQIIADAAKLLGIEPHNLSEEEARKALQRATITVEYTQINQATDQVKKQN